MKYAGLIASCLALILVACGPGLLADPAPTATPALTETVAARRTSNYETEIPPVTPAVPTLAAPSEPTVVVPFGDEA